MEIWEERVVEDGGRADINGAGVERLAKEERWAWECLRRTVVEGGSRLVEPELAVFLRTVGAAGESEGSVCYGSLDEHPRAVIHQL
jgi:hypothetical protein